MIEKVELTLEECRALDYYIKEWLIDCLKKDEFINNYSMVKALCNVQDKCAHAAHFDLMEVMTKLP